MSEDEIEALAEDFLARKRRGECPTISLYCENHPHLATEIRELFPTLLMLEDLKPTDDTIVGARSSKSELTVEQVDGYEIEEEIARGGTGAVLKARDLESGRHVAIKVLDADFASKPTANERFLREARLTAAIKHRNTVAIHDFGDQDGAPFLVMEWIEGETLYDRIKREAPMSNKAICKIGSQIASGLAAAHVLGVVHRDIKPTNILLQKPNGQVKITDFGLSRENDDGDEASALTAEGEVLGTPDYMSPEQAEGEKVDFRSDLFSLGSVLYTMATGKMPFSANSITSILFNLIEAKPIPVQKINPAIRDSLAAVIQRLMQKDPDRRYRRATKVVDALEDALNGGA